MFKERQIIFFKDFKFNNGDNSKDKYFIILKETDENLIIGTLPTRKNKIPDFVNTDQGCINIEERQYNSYLFKKGKSICKNGFCFDMTTFIYGGDVDYYITDVMKSDYPLEGINFKIEGELTDFEYNNILMCLLNSNSVKRGIKKKLST